MSQDGYCPGSCNNQYRKAQALYKEALRSYGLAMEHWQPATAVPEPQKPEPPEIKPWYGEPVYCPRCRATIHRELAELDDLAALHAVQEPSLGGFDPDGPGRVGGSQDPRSPSSVTDDLDELAGHIREWEGIIRGQDPRPRRGFLASEITTVIAWLSAHFDSIIVREDIAEDFGTEVRRWHRELLSKVKAGSGRKHLKKPCPRCRLYTLWQGDGKTYIECVNEDCGRKLTREEFAGLDKVA